MQRIPKKNIRSGSLSINGLITGPRIRAVIGSPFFPYLVIFLFSSALYVNTLWNAYASDDGAVLTQNNFTMKGFRGIKDILTHDTFVGVWGEEGAQLVSGGRYRPLSIVTMAVEVGIYGQKPAISHAINLLLFSLTCIILYRILTSLLPAAEGSAFYFSLPFITVLLFAGQPIHTEVVANIKGRDEIMGLLFSLLALYAALRYIHTHRPIHLLWGTCVFFLALLSKENAITFVAVVPLTFYFFTSAKTRDYLIVLGMYLVPVAVFLFLRSIYTKAGLAAESTEIMNNPFAYLTKDSAGYIQRYATVVKVFLLYFEKLIFPHPLSHDNYYNQIPIVDATDPLFIFSLMLTVALLVYAIIGLRRKTIQSYAILYYFITFSVVSNVFFQIGDLMNERFLYVSSIGYCLLLGFILLKAKDRFKLPAQALTAILAVILLLYSVKTISRNRDWADDSTLFLRDVQTSTNSARVLNFAGAKLVGIADQDFTPFRRNGTLQKFFDMIKIDEDVSLIPDSVLKLQLRTRAVEYLKRSVAIYPRYSLAWKHLGIASYKLNHNPQDAISYYLQAEEIESNRFYDPWNDIGVIELENNMPYRAKVHFMRAMAIKPDEAECRSNLAIAYTNLGMADSALYWYNKTLEVKPKDAATYDKIGKLYGQQLHDLPGAIRYLSMAVGADSTLVDAYIDLSTAYTLAGMPEDAIHVTELCLSRYPDYPPLLMNMILYYRNRNDAQKVQEYTTRLNRANATH